MAAPLGRRKAPARAPTAAGALPEMIAIFPEGRCERAETSAKMWTRGQGFEQPRAILALARPASYVTISSPKTIRELSHVD
jgi:hypothetical protein